MEYDDDRQPAGPRSDVWETSEEPAPGFRHPWFVEEDREPLEMLFDAEGFPVILFEPVPLLRRRKGRRLLRFRRCAASLESSRRGDENRQRAFISMLARVPSPTRAASRP